MHDFLPVQFPYTLGTDVSGTIAEVGEQVEGWSAGDRVVARVDPPAGGALAQFAVVPAEQLITAPESIPLFLLSGAATKSRRTSVPTRSSTTQPARSPRRSTRSTWS